MSCDEIIELMQRDLDRDLSSIESKLLEQHIKQCSECSSFYHRLQSLSNNLEKLPKVDPPFSIVDSILPSLQEIDRQEAATSNQVIMPIRPKFWTRSRIAAGAVAASMLIGVYIINDYVLPTSQDMAISESGSMPAQDSADVQSPGISAFNASPSPGTADAVVPPMQDRDSKDGSVEMSALESPEAKQEQPITDDVAKQEVNENSTASAENVKATGSAENADSTAPAAEQKVPARNEAKQTAPDAANTETNTPSGDVPALGESAVAQEQLQDESAAAAITSFNKAEDNGTQYGITAQPEQESAPAPERRAYGLISPNNQYVATVVGRTIVIKDNEGQELLVSHVLPEQYEMRMKWESDTTLNYELYEVASSTDGAPKLVESWIIELSDEQPQEFLRK